MVRTKKKQNKRTGRGGGRWGMGEIVINPLNRNGIYFIDYENGEHTVRPLGRMGRKCAQLTGEFPRLMTPFTRWTPAVSFQFFFFFGFLFLSISLFITLLYPFSFLRGHRFHFDYRRRCLSSRMFFSLPRCWFLFSFFVFIFHFGLHSPRIFPVL